MLYIGCDPGNSGAVAAVTDKGKYVGVWDVPTIKVRSGGKNRTVCLTSELVAVFDNIQNLGQRAFYSSKECSVCLEFVRAMPGQGVVSMFSIGRSVGQFEGIIAALHLPSIQVTPQMWKKVMIGPGLGQDKQASIAAALRLLPSASKDLRLKKHDGRAEAILLALYHLRYRPVTPTPPAR